MDYSSRKLQCMNGISLSRLWKTENHKETIAREVQNCPDQRIGSGLYLFVKGAQEVGRAGGPHPFGHRGKPSHIDEQDNCVLRRTTTQRVRLGGDGFEQAR